MCAPFTIADWVDFNRKSEICNLKSFCAFDLATESRKIRKQLCFISQFIYGSVMRCDASFSER